MQSEPYVELMPIKLEHVNHVQKWLGTRLGKQNEKKSAILSSVVEILEVKVGWLI